MIVLRKPKSTAQSLAIGEALVGSVDGSNRTFNTPNSYESGKIFLSYNGQTLYSPDDFTETGLNEVTFVYIAPKPGAPIPRATYEMTA